MIKELIKYSKKWLEESIKQQNWYFDLFYACKYATYSTGNIFIGDFFKSMVFDKSNKIFLTWKDTYALHKIFVTIEIADKQLSQNWN